MFVDEAFLDKLITSQSKAIRYYLLFAIGLVVLGVVIIVVTLLFSGQLISDAFKALFGIGGAFVSSLSAFQIKEVLDRRERVETFKMIRGRMKHFEKERSEADEAMQKKIDDLLWQVVEKTALG